MPVAISRSWRASCMTLAYPRPRRVEPRWALRALRRPVGARVGKRRQPGLDRLALRLELRWQDDLRPELLERHVHREARAVVGDREQDAARLAEVDRVEVVAVDDAGGRDAHFRKMVLPARVLGDGRAPGDVVHGAGALAPAVERGGVVGDRAATAVAAQFP